MLIYCICTQYLLGAPFALITASIRRGMEVISLWHCWGGMEAQVSLKLENEISIFKKLVSRRKHEVLQNFFVNGCSDVGLQKTQWTNTSRWHCTPNHHRLWKLNTGLHASCAMSFSTLPPDSRTLVSKWNTKLPLIWKEDFGPLGNSPVLLLLSPGKTPLTLSVVQEWLNKRNTTTVAKFLDTSVCGGSWCLDPSLSPFLVNFTQILESILLDNPIKAAVLSVGCASFSSKLFPSTQLSVNMLGYSTLWTASLFGKWMFVAYPPCEGCQWLSSGQLLDQQSSPWLCSLVNQTERPFWRLRKHLQVFWVD